MTERDKWEGRMEAKLDDLTIIVKEQCSVCKDTREKYTGMIQDNRNKITALEVKSGVWGALAGMMAAIAAIIIKN